jgi:hypothetical protein
MSLEKLVNWDEFEKNQYVVLPTAEDWEEDVVGLRPFYDDPEKNPLPTPTGKLEFYSERIAKIYPDDQGTSADPQMDRKECHARRARLQLARQCLSAAAACPTTAAGACTPRLTISPGPVKSRPARCADMTAICTNPAGFILQKPKNAASRTATSSWYTTSAASCCAAPM